MVFPFTKVCSPSESDRMRGVMFYSNPPPSDNVSNLLPLLLFFFEPLSLSLMTESIFCGLNPLRASVLLPPSEELLSPYIVFSFPIPPPSEHLRLWTSKVDFFIAVGVLRFVFSQGHRQCSSSFLEASFSFELPSFSHPCFWARLRAILCRLDASFCPCSSRASFFFHALLQFAPVSLSRIFL